VISFTVPGTPAPGGSKKAFVNPRMGRVVVTDDAKNNAGWRQRVSVFARQAMEGRPPLDGPLALVLVFSVRRPKGHYGTGRNGGRLKAQFEDARPISKPDLTKLIRAAEDAMTGIVWHDDAQVVMQQTSKRYGDEAGVYVFVDRQGREDA
jgi:Holliday junction resolvase RusA-like endonuclease